MDDVAIRVDHVSKTFKLPHEKQSSLKSSLINFKKRGYETQQVLNDVSFEIKKGEFFGIVGRNGSGKSTLLKMLAGIYTPTKGNINVNGKLTPFIELGVGFNPELTGRENVFLNGALLGFSRREMAEMYNDIVEFAELERFMDQKLKNYSSGMQVRLAFSIATRAKSDILLIDEVLAVGDSAFQTKCYDYFSQLKALKKTVVFVSHDMGSVMRFCDRAIYIQQGEITLEGNAGKIAKEYDKQNERAVESDIDQANEKKTRTQKPLKISLLNTEGKNKSTFNHGEEIVIALDWAKTVSPRNAGISIFTDGRVVYGTNTSSETLDLGSGTRTLKLRVGLNLKPGIYNIIAGLFMGEDTRHADIFEPNGPRFIIESADEYPSQWEGYTKLKSTWQKD